MVDNKEIKILIAEDEDALSQVLTNKFTRFGYTVIIAKNGNEALKEMKDKKPDIVLLDLMMPDKNGFEVLVEKATDATIKNIPVLIFSNLNQEEDKKKVMALGAIDFYVKADLSINEVLAKVEGVLKGKKK